MTITPIRLTPRELQVVREVATGASAKRVALMLCMSEHTLNGHIKAISDRIPPHLWPAAARSKRIMLYWTAAEVLHIAPEIVEPAPFPSVLLAAPQK